MSTLAACCQRSLVCLAFLAVSAGCSSASDHDPPNDDDDGQSTASALAHPGDWQLPPDVAAKGDTEFVRYDPAPPWQDDGSGCGGTYKVGTQRLADFLKKTFPKIQDASGYSCRPNTAHPAVTSMHGTGRAVDLMLPFDGEDADNDAGDPIANWLVSNAETIGVQFIIWDHTGWLPAREPEKTYHYTGPNPHIDHIHVELNSDGAAATTPFFVDGAGAVRATEGSAER